MRWYQAAAVVSLSQCENDRIINLRRKLTKSIRRIWQLSKAAQNALQFHSCHISNNLVIIYGKRDGTDCQIITTIRQDKIILESSVPDFTESEVATIIKTLSYNLPSNFDLESKGINLVRCMEYAISWIA